MKRRDAIIDELHQFRERMGRAHDFDVDRIAATIRQHEQEAGRPPMTVTSVRTTRRGNTRTRRAAQQRDGAVGA